MSKYILTFVLIALAGGFAGWVLSALFGHGSAAQSAGTGWGFGVGALAGLVYCGLAALRK